MVHNVPKFIDGDTVRISQNALTVAPRSDKRGQNVTIDGEAWEIYEPVDEPTGAGYWYTVLFSDGSTDYIHEYELKLLD